MVAGRRNQPRAGFCAENFTESTPGLRAVLERQRARTLAVEKATRTIIPWMFHRTGRPIKSFRRAWVTACTAAGLSGRIPHDFRRTAVRNLERAGVPRSTAMKMVGHKTESIYRRYAIVDEAMLKEGAVKLQTLHEAQGSVAPVISLSQAIRTTRVSSSTVRVSRAQRARQVRSARAKSLKASEKQMVGWDGIEPPTPGFSDLGPSWCKCAQLLATAREGADGVVRWSALECATVRLS